MSPFISRGILWIIADQACLFGWCWGVEDLFLCPSHLFVWTGEEKRERERSTRRAHRVLRIINVLDAFHWKGSSHHDSDWMTGDDSNLWELMEYIVDQTSRLLPMGWADLHELKYSVSHRIETNTCQTEWSRPTEIFPFECSSQRIAQCSSLCHARYWWSRPTSTSDTFAEHVLQQSTPSDGQRIEWEWRNHCETLLRQSAIRRWCGSAMEHVVDCRHANADRTLLN